MQYMNLSLPALHLNFAHYNNHMTANRLLCIIRQLCINMTDGFLGVFGRKLMMYANCVQSTLVQVGPSLTVVYNALAHTDHVGEIILSIYTVYMICLQQMYILSKENPTWHNRASVSYDYRKTDEYL